MISLPSLPAFLEEMKCQSLSRVRHCNLMDCSWPGSFVQGILQARISGSIAIPFSRGSSRPRVGIPVLCIVRQILYCLSHQISTLLPSPLPVSFQFSSVTQLCPTLFEPTDYSTPGLPVHHQLPEFTQTDVHWAGDATQPSHPLSPSPPAFTFPASGSFQMSEFFCIRWPKYWSFSFNTSPSSEHSGLISFRMDWLDLLAVQGTLKVFSNTMVQKHQFFSAQLSL